MISNEQILMQIEKQLHQAKMKDNEQSIREALAAIRALCDVSLDTTTSQPPVELVESRVQQQPILAQAKALQEDDANGESLFDF